MTDFLDNPLVQAILGLIAGVALLGWFGWLKFKRDEKVVAEFLKNSGVDSRSAFRTTSEISAGTDLHEKRIRIVCGKSARIGPTQDEKDTWKLHG